MATEADQVDDNEGEAAPPKGGKKGLVIMLATLLLLGGGGAGAWFKFGGKKDADKKEAVVKLPPRYINLDPPFVVNFESESMVRFLQVTVDVMTRDPAVELLVKDNDPRVRNDLLLILGNQSYESVSTLEGKEALRQRCLESVRVIVKEMGGDATKVEALYFTAFVMQ
jgi:flagellar protein FliL